MLSGIHRGHVLSFPRRHGEKVTLKLWINQDERCRIAGLQGAIAPSSAQVASLCSIMFILCEPLWYSVEVKSSQKAVLAFSIEPQCKCALVNYGNFEKLVKPEHPLQWRKRSVGSISQVKCLNLSWLTAYASPVHSREIHGQVQCTGCCASGSDCTSLSL